jgi:hypothetical protein
MKRRILLGAVAGMAMACSLSSAAQDRGYWRAASSAATTITGDVAISDTKITINFTGFTLAPIRKLTAAEVMATFDAEADAGGSGNLYRLTVPAAKRFLHHNTLCGSEDTQWMATYVEDRTLRVAFFSGADAPVMTVDALANSTDLCGMFTYVR